jgi:protein-L-isoaspartate(D-aspartate) O-methyltransferase
MRQRSAIVAVLAVVAACGNSRDADPVKRDQDLARRDPPAPAPVPAPPADPTPVDQYTGPRDRLVDGIVGVRDHAVLAAMRRVPRHRFVPPDMRDRAYDDTALPIGFGLTISQPSIVAMMTEAAHVDSGDKVLEIGTGSGYQAAVLAELGAKVYTIEIHPELAERTGKLLDKLGLDSKISLQVGDGYFGWPLQAPFDAILVTCAAARVPPKLLPQLRPGGRMVLPLGDETSQVLTVLTKNADGTYDQSALLEVLFGRMTGAIEDEP